MFVQAPRRQRSSSKGARWPLALILLLAALPRLFGVNWDGGYYAHPDELNTVGVVLQRLSWPDADALAELREPDYSPMNARRITPKGDRYDYSYGTLLPYALKGASNAVAKLTGKPEYATGESLYRVARPMAAIADLLTVLTLYLLGRRLFGVRVGLLAAAFSGLTALQVQHSHFYVAEPLMTAFLTAALLQIVRALQDRSGWAVAWAGVLMGLAVGTKPSSAAFVPAGLAILFFGALLARPSGTRSGWASGTSRGLQWALLAGVLALVAWAVCEPYAVLDLRTYLDNINRESQIQRGIIDMPYTRQYIGTVPGWYHVSQYVRWGAGGPLGIAAVAGLVWGLYRVARRDWWTAVLLVWIAPYSVSILLLEAKWLRYMIPITPVLVLLAASMLWSWHERLQGASDRAPLLKALRPRLALIAMAAVLVGSGLWVLAWSRIYARPHNWVEASEWIYANVPPNSTLAYEAWDQPLPHGLPGKDRDQYEYYVVDTYQDLPPSEKLAEVRNLLRTSDYLVYPTNRLYSAVPHLPWRYAVAIRYFDALFDGQLGYREVARFDYGPGLGPLQMPREGADDNVAVYDHPEVRIFKKERDLEDWELDALFADAVQSPWAATRHPENGAERSLLLPAYHDAADTGLPYFGGGASSTVGATARWLLTLEWLGLVAWLGLGGLLRPLPDRGWVLAKLLGLLLPAWLAWFLPSVGALPAGVGTTWLAALALAGGALAVGLARRRAILDNLRRSWRAMLGFEALFLGLFGLGCHLRAANPDLWQPYWGGEKPMELAFINGILRSSELPPYDPWYAGGYINYYYFGQWLVATLMRLAAVGPQWGFNLGVATMLALTGTLAAALGYTIARQFGRAAGALVGGLSLLFVLGVGNLDGAVQAWQIARDPAKSGLLQSFDFWRSTRLSTFINEFPFFTFLYGDLHAHMIVMPIGLALLLLGVLLVTGGRELRPPSVLLTSALGGLLLGAAATTNPWDVPGYGGLFVLALALHWFCHAGTARRRLALGVASVGAFGLTAAAGYAPFFASFKSFYGDVGVVRDPTPLPLYLNMLGLFLFAVAWHGVARSWNAPGGQKALLAVLALALLGAWWSRDVLGLLLGLLALTLWTVWQGRRSAPHVVWGVLAAGGLLIWVGIETLYLKDFLEGGDWYRMNTVFKFGLQSWVLLGVGCAGLVWLALSATRTRIGRAVPLGILAALLSASLVYPVYGSAARLQQRFPKPPQGLTLDGERFLETATLANESGRELEFRHDLDAIRWLRENVERPETLAEASIGPYRGNGGRVSMLTGLPALVGWDNHERQQRYPDPVSERDREIRDLYHSPDPRRALEVISRYNVRYVYVGPVERLHEYAGEPPQRYASREGLAKLDSLARSGMLRVAYRNPGVTVYEVLPSWSWRVSALGA